MTRNLLSLVPTINKFMACEDTIPHPHTLGSCAKKHHNQIAQNYWPRDWSDSTVGQAFTLHPAWARVPSLALCMVPRALQDQFLITEAVLSSKHSWLWPRTHTQTKNVVDQNKNLQSSQRESDLLRNIGASDRKERPKKRE